MIWLADLSVTFGLVTMSMFADAQFQGEGRALPPPKTSFEGNENAEYAAWQMSRQVANRQQAGSF